MVLLMSRVKHDIHENIADGMNGIVAVETFIHQPIESFGTDVASPNATWFSTTTWAMA